MKDFKEVINYFSKAATETHEKDIIALSLEGSMAMPELPEVETIVRDLKKEPILDQTIVAAEVYWPRTIATPTVEKFIAHFKNDKILDVTRRAKFIVLHLKSRSSVLIHLRMSGRIHIAARKEPRQKHQHVILRFRNGRELRFQDPRKFGRWYLLENTDEIFNRLGPEPLEASFTAKMFAERFRNKNRQLKPLLLDQSFVAGLGNIYVDETLWEACLHPGRRSGSLEEIEIKRLHKAIRKVLRKGIRNLGTSLGISDTNYYSVGGRRGRNQDSLNVFRRTGDPCPSCGVKITRIIIAQRSTHLCPHCQSFTPKIKTAD